MKFVAKKNATEAFLLGAILLASVAVAAVPQNRPVARSGTAAAESEAEELQRPRPRGVGNSAPSSVDLYRNMVMFEQEQGNVDSDGEDNDDDDDSAAGDSLLPMAGRGGNDGLSDDQPALKCVSCAGRLPRQGVHVDEEQSYCLPDGGGSILDTSAGEDDSTKDYQSVCTGAVRCWKAKIRESDGSVRVSRGCASIGDKRSAKAGGGSQQPLLNPCNGAVRVAATYNDSAKGQERLQPYAVWTTSYSQQQPPRYGAAAPPPGYAIECCAGHELCNGGAFPSLPGDDAADADGDWPIVAAAVAWWRRSPASAVATFVFATAAIVAAAVAAISFVRRRKNASKKRRGGRRRRRRRSKSGRSERRPRKRCGYDSDDSDKKRRFSFDSSASSTASSSSLPSIGSSSAVSSCCEGKAAARGRRRSSRRRRRGRPSAMNMIDLLKDVVVVAGDGADGRPAYATPYSPAVAGGTDSAADYGTSPPPYQQQQKEDDWTSGSGYGMPVLVQRTLAKQIQLRQLVGKGRYGEVWRATYWNGGHEHVAVKIFLSKDEPSWKRETEIYSTVLMRHDNILGFIGSDIMTSRNSYTTQLLLITHYHQHGSLYDFLQTNMAIENINNGSTAGIRPPLTINQMLNVLYTVASGICHLHTEIHGTQGKPGIAHRDIKSKNILIKCAKTGTCCVADFGMAVTSRDATLPAQTTTTAGLNNQNTRVGTKRYMAPEVLDDTIASAAELALTSTSTITASGSSTATLPSAYWCFDAYRRGDVYSYALVMWEVLSRTLVSSNSNNSNEEQQRIVDNGYNPYMYRAPYQDRGAGWDPGFDDMRRIVCSGDPVLSRPGIATEWVEDPIVNTVVLSMRECWSNNPNARLPMLRVKKNLSKLLVQNSQEEQLDK